MATTDSSPQRAYRAACPNCGAPVEFRSAASPFAVCSFCRSTVVRTGDELRKIGESAELFDDHTPLQLGVAGRHQGAPFTLVGRLQYRYADGTWNEWHALFESGPEQQKSGWLSEDNGRYVVAFDASLTTPVPPPEQLRPGAPLTVEGQSWTVASVVAAKLIAAEGELPKRPNLEHGFVVADVRSSRGEVGTIDYTDPARPGWSIGTSVDLPALALTGLREDSEKTLAGRTLQCPGCGAPLQVKLATTQSIVCGQCKAVVDLTSAAQGNVGGDLAHYAQVGGSEPQIPLGSVGTLALGSTEALPWQVVGYVERCEIAQSAGDEQAFWREYLLYHRTQGFAFLVDADDGWSWSAPITGAPQSFGESVKHEGVLYRKLYDYVGKVTYVLGEFYWRLAREERTANTDYVGTGAASRKRLNREQTEGEGTREVVWSAGETLTADSVLGAFRLAPDKRAALQRDVLPTAFSGGGRFAKIVLWIFILFIVLVLFRCGSGGGAAACTETRNTFGPASQEYQNCLNSRSSGGGYRSSGGSFGGFSTGGGHK
ncbi:MAG TPA: DUF4178 domain-containing protein [Caldimonas sp.]|nr:DUF4178 domain-containing protein [Caldimonas sp.]HEX4233011.1 DUF4178 domain-containing protein [Caldimonas sp.]